MTVRDDKDYNRVLLHSDYSTITGRGGPPKVSCLPKNGSLHFEMLMSGVVRTSSKPYTLHPKPCTQCYWILVEIISFMTGYLGPLNPKPETEFLGAFTLAWQETVGVILGCLQIRTSHLQKRIGLFKRFGGFPKLGVSSRGSILGSAYFGKLPCGVGNLGCSNVHICIAPSLCSLPHMYSSFTLLFVKVEV